MRLFKLRRYKILPLAITFCFFEANRLFASGMSIDIKADELEYEMGGERVNAAGNVVLKYRGLIINADEITVDIPGKKITVSGNALFQRDSSTLRFSTGSYDIAQDFVESHEVSGILLPWRFTAHETISEKNKHTCRNAALTTCDLKEPHYKIKSTRMTIVPDEMFSVYNAIFYIGKVPVFYLPYWWRSFKRSRLNVSGEPGYNSIDGITLKTVISYQFSDSVDSRLFVDLFSKRGTGKGLESNYYVRDKTKSTLYLYHIKEGTSGIERWRWRGFLWNKLSPDWSVQSEIHFISDEKFNQSYFSESWDLTERQINSNIAFTRQTHASNLRISASKKDTFDIKRNKYVQRYAAFPGIEYVRYRKNIGGFYPEFSGYIVRSSTGDDVAFLYDMQSRFSVTRQERLLRNLTLTPNIGFSANLTEALKDDFKFFGRYFVGSGLRYSPIAILDMDLEYGFSQRLRPNSMEVDPAGIEKNAINSSVFLYPSSKIYWKITSGYDYIMAKEKPLINEVIFTMAKNVFNFRHQMTLSPSRYDNMQVIYSYSDILSLNASHDNNMTEPKPIGLGGTLGLKIGDKTTLSYGISGNLIENDYRPLAQNVTLLRDLHCWESRIIYRKAAALEELFIQLNLKTAGFAPPAAREIEKEFYPWR